MAGPLPTYSPWDVSVADLVGRQRRVVVGSLGCRPGVCGGPKETACCEAVGSFTPESHDSVQDSKEVFWANLASGCLRAATEVLYKRAGIVLGRRNMLLVNFSHPVTDAQRRAIEHLLGMELQATLEVPTQFDHHRPFADQVREVCERISLTPIQWQTEKLVVKLPSLDAIAACVLAELHGRMGYFPPIIRLRPVEGSVVREYEVAEIIPLQTIRDRARTER